MAIHCYPNGNGRHARLAADLLLRKMGQERFSWGGKNLVDLKETRKRYIAVLQAADGHDIGTFVEVAQTLDKCAADLGIDYLAGYTALVQKGMTRGDKALIESIPEALSENVLRIE